MWSDLSSYGPLSRLSRSPLMKAFDNFDEDPFERMKNNKRRVYCLATSGGITILNIAPR